MCDSRTCLEALVEDSAGGEYGGVHRSEGSDQSLRRRVAVSGNRETSSGKAQIAQISKHCSVYLPLEF